MRDRSNWDAGLPPSEESKEILNFWFEECKPVQWFRRDPGFDAVVSSRFKPKVEDALHGRLSHWEQQAEPALALVLLLDQFTRQLWRDSPLAFSGDPLALELSLKAEQRGWIAREPHRPRRQFWLMPRLHCEDLNIQTAAIPLFERWTDPKTCAIAERYRDILATYGRFPHRDAIRQTGTNGLI